MLSITYRRWITTSSFLAGLVILFLCLTAFTPAAQQNVPTLFLTPATAAPGGTLYLGGYNLPSGNNEVWLSGEFGDIPLNDVEVDAIGVVREAIAIPVDIPAGEYVLFVNDPMIRHPVTIQQPPTITFSPDVGEAGTEVQFTVSNLMTGTLQINFDGAPVVGPLVVNAGRYSGQFITPHDRPTETNVYVPLQVINQVDGRMLGQTEASFYVAPPSFPPPFKFENVEFSAVNLEPGEFFTVTGQINFGGLGRGAVSFTPQELQEMNLHIMWADPDQFPFPINQTTPQISEDGSFSVVAAAPSLLNGDMTTAKTGSHVGLVLEMKNEQLFYDAPLMVNPGKQTLRVHVINENGQGIQGALVIGPGSKTGQGSVTVESEAGLQLGHFELSDLPNFGSQFVNPFGQSWTYNDPFNCPPADGRGPTDLQGNFTFNVDFEQAAFDIANNQTWVSGSLPNKKSKNIEAPIRQSYSFSVNARYQGYGNENGENEEFQSAFTYDRDKKKFFYIETGEVIENNIFVVQLKELDPNAEIKLPLHPTIVGASVKAKLNNYLGTGIPVTGFGTWVSFADKEAYPDEIFNTIRPIRITFQHNAAKDGALDTDNMTFTLHENTPNEVTYQFQQDGNPNLEQCDGTLTYYVEIPDSHRLPVGIHQGRISIADTLGNVAQHYIRLQFEPAPKWIANSTLKNRVINILGINVQLTADVLSKNDNNSSSQIGANVPAGVGQLDNEAGAHGRLTQNITGAQFNNVRYEGASTSMAMNNRPDDIRASGSVGSASKPLTFGDQIPILNTGKIPLFRHQWGSWPIAKATIGADMWFKADMTYSGTILINPNGQTSTTLHVTPSATVGVDTWFDLSALFGIVKADAHAIPQITMCIPYTFVNGQKTDSSKYFIYRLDVEYSAQVGKCPICKKKSGREEIFNEPKNPPTPHCAASAKLTADQSQTTEPPPSAHPSMATDTLGNTLSIWQTEQNDIVSSQYDGISWTAPTTVSDSGGSAPQVAFLSPNEALAVWSQIGLTEVTADTSFTETVKAQHLVYATWNGGSWSAPQPLTLPTTGDGNVVLASCQTTDEVCADAGEITAVWVRDVVGALAENQFRLYYARFKNGSWSTPTPVDSGSTASDTQPTLVYRDGSPIVGWIRDEDRDPGTVDDRLFVLRNLDDAPQVHFPEGLPVGLAEPSMVVNPTDSLLNIAFTYIKDPQAHIGNQRQLGTAKQLCYGLNCLWDYQLIKDLHERDLHVENPKLTISFDGKRVITFRGLGYGPTPDGQLNIMTGDPVGMRLGTGELAQINADFNSSIHNPVFLTGNGQVNWQATALYDPLLQTIHIAAVQGTVPEVSGDTFSRITFADPTAETGLYFTSQQQDPDFAIVSIQPETFYPDAESAFFTTVTVVNNGRNWSGEEEGIEMALIASWDGPAGVGETAGSTIVPVLLTGEMTEIDLFVFAPANPDIEHELYITINPNMEAAEQIVSNNSMAITMAGIPIPQTLTASTKQASSLVHLSWDAVDDHRVTGYRIYEQLEDGSFIPTGSTPTHGFLDLTAFFAQPTTYAITAFTENGSESPLSETITVTPQQFMIWLPMAISD